MGTMKNFNKIIFESLIDNSKYQFSEDENGNVFCTFSINNDLLVHAKLFNEVLSFITTDKNGESKNMTEKEFSFNYSNEYDEFKEKLTSYQNSNAEQKIDDENVSKIDDFNDQLTDVETNDPNVRLNKDLKLNDMLFNFKVLNDLMVENYVECCFEFFDNKKNQRFGVRSLLFVKKVNSIIIKIILQDDRGQVLQNMTEIDFKIAYPDVLLTFKEAISKFEEYLNNLK